MAEVGGTLARCGGLSWEEPWESWAEPGEALLRAIRGGPGVKVEQKGHVVKGLQVMQRLHAERDMSGRDQGQGEGVKTGKLLASQGEGRRLWPSAFQFE